MTKTLARKLLVHYNKCIKEVKATSDMTKIWYILREYYTNRGLCYCANNVFQKYIYHDEWVAAFCVDETGNWGVMPIYCNTPFETLEALQLRTNNLKSLLN
jgi:hypothetical protein